MNRGQILVVASVLFVAVCGSAWVRLRHANQRLESQLHAARAGHAEVIRRQNANATLRVIAERARTDAAAAQTDLEREVARAHRNVAELERQAQDRYEAKRVAQRAEEERLGRNRDLTQGPVLVENCGNVGRGTAADAFQTLVWASARGDDALVAQLIAVDGVGRDVMQAVLAGLPESQRVKYPTPERFVALYVADSISTIAAVQITKQTEIDPLHRVLEIARTDGKTTEIPMELGTGGWQVGIDASAAKKIGRYLVGVAMGKQ